MSENDLIALMAAVMAVGKEGKYFNPEQIVTRARDLLAEVDRQVGVDKPAPAGAEPADEPAGTSAAMPSLVDLL